MHSEQAVARSEWVVGIDSLTSLSRIDMYLFQQQDRGGSVAIILLLLFFYRTY